MDISIIDLIGILLATFIAGVAVGRFVEKVSSYISDSKKDRRPSKD